MTDAPEMYLIEKRGLYYRPEACGYTGIRDEAGTWSFDDAVCMFPNIASENQDGVTIISLSDAPEFSGSCCEGIKLRYVLGQRDAQAARIAELEAEVDSLENISNRMADKLELMSSEHDLNICYSMAIDVLDMHTDFVALKGTTNDT